MRRDFKKIEAAKVLQGRCRVCGHVPEDSRGLDAHHPIPRSLTQTEDLLIVLCRPCHNDVEAKRVELLSYLTTAEQAQAVILAGSIEKARSYLAPTTYRKQWEAMAA
jgi:hypothetical protein